MPIPSPTKGETRDEFVTRCMSNDVMKSEFPKQKTRAAVCFRRWDTKMKKQANRLKEDEDMPDYTKPISSSNPPESKGIHDGEELPEDEIYTDNSKKPRTKEEEVEVTDEEREEMEADGEATVKLKAVKETKPSAKSKTTTK